MRLTIGCLLMTVLLAGCAKLGPYDEGCQSDNDCPPRTTCDDGTCVPKSPPSCERDSDCPSGWTCEDHLCKPPAVKPDDEVPPTDEPPVTPPPECDADSDCPSGKWCSDHKCVPGCRSDSDCPPGNRCDNHACVPVCQHACCKDADCPPPLICEDHECVPVCPPPGEDPCKHKPTSCKQGKTLICHIPPGNPGNKHTICVGNSAVPAHLAHGDYLGECVCK